MDLFSIVAAFTSIENIGKLVNIGNFLAFVLVCMAVWQMRIVSPDTPRTFRLKNLPLVASLGILFNLGLMFGLHWENWLRLGVWLMIGFAIYFLMGKGAVNWVKTPLRQQLAHYQTKQWLMANG